MEKPLNAVVSASDTPTNLKQIVDDLISSSLACALHNKSKVVNEIDKGIVFGPANEAVVGILNELLTTVIENSRNGDIHITADRFQDIVAVQIQERNNYNGYALSYSIGSIEPEAISLGGHIAIKGPQKRITTISFCFPDQVAA